MIPGLVEGRAVDVGAGNWPSCIGRERDVPSPRLRVVCPSTCRAIRLTFRGAGAKENAVGEVQPDEEYLPRVAGGKEEYT